MCGKSVIVFGSRSIIVATLIMVECTKGASWCRSETTPAAGLEPGFVGRIPSRLAYDDGSNLRVQIIKGLRSRAARPGFRQCGSAAWHGAVNPLSRDRGKEGGPVSNDKAIDTPLKEAQRQAQKVATEYMYHLALNRQLPHALEDYHVEAVLNGAEPPYRPGEVRYLPIEAVVTTNDETLPAALLKAGITREQGHVLISRQIEKNRKLWESEFSSDRPFDPEPRFHTVLDGKTYPVVILDHEPGVNRKKIIGDRLRPLGYKGGKSYSYTKKLSENETSGCSFDFGTWRGTLNSAFTYDYNRHNTSEDVNDRKQRLLLRLPLIYWTVGMQEHAEGIAVADIPHTTEKNLMRTFDNIAFLAKKLEEDMVPRWRQVVTQLGIT